MHMNLKQYITENGHGSAARLAKQANINRMYLCQITTGRRKPSAAMAERIARATGFVVSIESLRPDIAQMFKDKQGITQTEKETLNGTECPTSRSNASEITHMESGAVAQSREAESAQY